MFDLFFESALLPGGWARDVRVSAAADGSIERVEVGVDGAAFDRVVGIAVPGMPNLHSHAFQRALAGLAERGSGSGDTFWSWRKRMYAFLERLGPDDVEAIATQLYVELLRHGYTAVAEFHYLRNDLGGRPFDDPVEMGRRILAAAGRAGIGLTLLPVVYRAGDFGGADIAPGQRRFHASVQDLIADVAILGASVDDASARVGLALHSLRAVSPGDLVEGLEAASLFDPSLPVHIHVAEQRSEVEACLAWSGARPVAWLLDNAAVDSRWCLVHATHMDDAEVRALAVAGAVAGLCPTTEANLGDGIFPLDRYAAEGGSWGIGSDSHVSVSPVAELRLLEYGQRLGLGVRNVAAGSEDRSTARVLLDAAWRGGAQACGRALGRIEPGSRADIVVLDPDHPALVGRNEDTLLDSWIFSGEDTPVRDVYVSGRQVVRDGRHPLQEEVLAAYRGVVRRLGSGGT